MMEPLGSCSSEKTANCELPPPAGSTAIVTWLVLASPIEQKMSTGISVMVFLKKRSTSPDGKALDCASAQMPMDSRRSIAGSSASKLRTTSIFWEESQRGISASLCVHFSGCSVNR